MMAKLLGMQSLVVIWQQDVKLLNNIILLHITHPPQNHISATVNEVSIGSDNRLSPVRLQAII